jgi:LacI family transcriptional regulator
MNIKAVARRARVSIATVSRTINDPSTVSPDTAAKVRNAIRALNYYPSASARALVSGRSRTLGLIISDIANPFFPELVKGFEDLAMRHDHLVIVTNTNYSPERMAQCVRSMLERKVDGVAIMTSEMDPTLVEELTRRGVPIAFLDVGSVDKHSSNMKIDYLSGIRQAVEHIVELGHRRIGFISGPTHLKSARIRRSAFLKTLEKCGIAVEEDLIKEGDHRFQGGQEAMLRLLDLRRPPTAVLTSNDLTAIGALHAIYERGLRVPDDISIVGFDDIPLSQFSQPPLTTVRIDCKELGQRAFYALQHVLSSKQAQGQEYRIPTELILRETTGRPPRAR